MMTREMMEEIFEDYCRRYDLAWYELFDGDLFDSVMTEIATAEGFTPADGDLLDVLLDRDSVFAEWYYEMAGDL